VASSRPTFGSHKQVEILYATETGNARRTSGSLKPDADEWFRVERSIEANRADLALAGIWHSHPQTSARHGQPSSADLESWLTVLDWNEERGRSTAFSVGQIYCASEFWGDSWARPGLHAWVVRREGYSQHSVCEPARVRQR
jgi:hypothetical protein